MDREYVEKHRLIERYVQDRLSPEEAAEFEAFFMDQPDIIAELEAHRVLQETLPEVLDEPSSKPEGDAPQEKPVKDVSK